MPKPSKTKGDVVPSKGSAGTSDPRFASFQTDPRFRLPSKNKAKTKLDSRFSHALGNSEFANTAKVDRYGRKVKTEKKNRALHSLYERAPELKGEEDEDEEEDEEGEEGGKGEDDNEDDFEVDDDEVVQRELRRAHRKIDPARGGGFSESESDDSSEDDSDSDAEDEAAVATDDVERFKEQQEDVESGEVTSRIAIVNLDWDHLKSVDIMALLSSFAPEGGRVERVSIFPSEFGKERMQDEEINGPPKELFKGEKKRREEEDSSDDDDSDANANADPYANIKKNYHKHKSEETDEGMKSDALRRYQLDRLRYYYAVMECSSPAVAKKIYDATDGTEYQSSSNLLDLRFVPDDVTFDDPPRDTCTKIPESYKPVEFVTSALQSSKVKLTWDMHPEEMSRKEAQKKVFGGSRAEIEENDLNAYLASDTSDSEPEEQTGDAPKLNKKEQQRKSIRAALGLPDEPAPREKKEEAGDMEVTFLPAFSEKASKKAEPEEETTIEKYKRKEKERKERKRQEAKARRGEAEEEGDKGDDLGFDDPFFTQAEEPKLSKSAQKKEERLKKRAAREAAEAESAEQAAHLKNVVAEDGEIDHPGHFNMKDIMRAEKVKSKKGKAAKRLKEKLEKQGGNLQSGAEMDVGDDRFKAVFDSHEFAIDPSNPQFGKTEGMKKILEEGRRKRSGGDIEGRKSKKGRR